MNSVEMSKNHLMCDMIGKEMNILYVNFYLQFDPLHNTCEYKQCEQTCNCQVEFIYFLNNYTT